MSNKEKQQEILKMEVNKAPYGFGLKINIEKAKAHKEEVMKGCGKKFFTRRTPNGHILEKGDTSNSSPKVLLVCGNNLSHTFCRNCQAIINKYTENGI